MIVVRIHGGLGNQLFCYAFAKYISIRLNRLVFIDNFSGFVNDKYRRRFELFRFSITLSSASNFYCFKFPLGIAVQKVMRKIFSYYPTRLIWYIREENFNYLELEKRHKCNKFIYIEGYWQNFCYCSSIRSLLVSELVINNTIFDDSTKCLFNNIKKNTKSVAIHLRFLSQYSGDGKLIGKYDRFHDLDLDYYQKAINYINIKLQNPTFYIFGDLHGFLKEYLKDCIHYYINSDKLPDAVINDFWLMSACNNYILSNSTYSWWANWLSQNDEKIVIAPAMSFWHNEHLFDSDKMQVLI